MIPFESVFGMIGIWACFRPPVVVSSMIKKAEIVRKNKKIGEKTKKFWPAAPERPHDRPLLPAIIKIAK